MVDLNHLQVTSLSQLVDIPTIFKIIKIVFIKKKNDNNYKNPY